MSGEFESWREWIAGILATAVLTVAGWWKGRMQVRRDARSDAAAQDWHDGNAQVIATLRAEIVRLAATVNDLSVRLDMETKRRYEAEAKSAELQLRVSVLEAELAELRGAATA